MRTDVPFLCARPATLRAAAALAATALLPAQQQFAELQKRALPRAAEVTGALVFGDVDGDGDLDLVCGRRAQTLLWRNDGTGVFTDVTAASLPATCDSAGPLVLGDVDGDGDLDLFCGRGGQDRLFRNDGSGVFTDVTAACLPVSTASTLAAVLGDVDGDGDLDLVCGDSGQNRLYRNDGSGVFTDDTAATMPAANDWTTSLALGDVDGDGDRDLVVGNMGQDRLCRNDGNGVFTDVTAAQLPVDNDDASDVELGDVDGDGDLDLAIGNAYWRQNRLYLNDGTGAFADATAARLPAAADFTNAIAFGDVDGDGDLDLVVGDSDWHAGLQSRLYRNDGSGAFTDDTAASLPGCHDATNSIALGDVDGDGDLDVAVGNGGHGMFGGDFGDPDRLLLNQGGGTFLDATAPRLPVDRDWTLAIAAGDVDGDGDQDLVFGVGWARDRLCRNDGTGTFTDDSGTCLPANADATAGVALGDVDGDGDLDLVCGIDGQDRLYTNDGAGTFTDVTAGRMPARSDWTNAVALGDVDGDGDLDLVLANHGAQNRLYENDGSGTFTDVTAARLPADNDGTSAIALGDVDGDGDLDLVCGNLMQDRLYLNDGLGAFTDATAARLPFDADETYGVALGDVDGDGDLDLAIGCAPGLSAQYNRIYRNDGAGYFTDVSGSCLPAGFGSAQCVVLADVDGDGDLDLVYGNGHHNPAGEIGYRNQLLLNDGAGVFTDASARLPDARAHTDAVAAADVDGDGDLDLVFGNAGVSGRRDVLYLNLQRQLDAPLLLRSGAVYSFEAYARHAPPSQTDLAFPLVSPLPAAIPIPPLGTLGLDPTVMVALPWFPIPQPAGVGGVTVAVPSVPGLLGMTLRGQAVLYPVPGVPRLSNVTADVLMR